MNDSRSNSKNLGHFLSSELFKVAKESSHFLGKFETIENLLSINDKLSSKDQLELSRFFSLCLELHNCAERYFKAYPSKSGLNDLSKFFITFKHTKKDFDFFVKNFSLDFVFTAHPTEVFPLSILKSLKQIELLIEKLYSAKLPETKHRLTQSLRAQLTALWLTDEIYREKPDVEDEADRLFYIFETSLWKATPYFFRRYYWEYKSHFEVSPKYYPKLKFSSWIGGDKDGNPFVKAEATEKIIRKSRRKVLRLVLRELYPLRDELLIKTKQKDFYPKSSFPYKTLVDEIIFDIQNHLFKRLENDVECLSHSISKRLGLIYENLCKDKAKRIADRRVRSLIDRINTFTLSPLKLDLRQDSEVHEEILNEVKGLKNIETKNLSEQSQDFFKTLKLAKNFKPCPFNCYIISMTRSEKDIANLKQLLDIAKVQLDIVPLFETPDDIRNAEKTLNSTTEKNTVKINQIMWGYSDSTKKGGRLASAWNVYKAQEKALKSFPDGLHFYGRGGSIARGGGKTEPVFNLIPPGLSKKGFRQTFQGEVMQDDFGLKARTIKTLEKYFIHSCTNAFSEKKISKTLRKKIDALSLKSESLFKQKFYVENELNENFDKHSPVAIINTMNLGSRPSKRSSKSKGVSYRAIPWVFGWAQTRGALPIWYGLQATLPELLNLKSESFFIESFLKLISSGLKKTDSEIFKSYFGNELPQTHEDLINIKKLLCKKDSVKLDKHKEKMVHFLHEVQTKHLHKKKLTPIEKEIMIIATQGIASYLGKSG